MARKRQDPLQSLRGPSKAASALVKIQPVGQDAPSSTKIPLMSHEDRLKLIRAPLPMLSQIVIAKSWGGTHVGNAGCVPTEGHRTWQVSTADESYLRYGRSDDERSSD